MLQHILVIITDSKSRFKEKYQNHQTNHFCNLSKLFGWIGILKENFFFKTKIDKELKKNTRKFLFKVED